MVAFEVKSRNSKQYMLCNFGIAHAAFLPTIGDCLRIHVLLVLICAC